MEFDIHISKIFDALPPSPFSAKNLGVAARWFAQPVASRVFDFITVKRILSLWEQACYELLPEEQRGLATLPALRGSSGSWWMWSQQVRQPVVMKVKPGEAANEKIAFDVAYCLALPVPAVQLWMPPPFIDDRQKYYSTSVRAFDHFCMVDEASKSALSVDPFRRGMYVFDCWFFNKDRHWKNVVCNKEAPSGSPCTAYIDHANVLTDAKSSMKPEHRIDTTPPLPLTGLSDSAHAVIHRIEAFPDRLLKDIVFRLPSTAFTPKNSQQAIVDRLLRRRDKLRAVVNQNPHFHL